MRTKGRVKISQNFVDIWYECSEWFIRLVSISVFAVAALFDDFLGAVNDISDQTGAADFEDVIPILQREIPGLQVYELEEDEGQGDDDDEPSLEDFRDVEGRVARMVLPALWHMYLKLSIFHHSMQILTTRKMWSQKKYEKFGWNRPIWTVLASLASKIRSYWPVSPLFWHTL